jgi:UDPglucose 6-dehydrogenase
MARIAIVGAGHVGLVYAAGLAELDHTVRVVDIDASRVARLEQGEVWFYEPGLADAIAAGRSRGLIEFTTNYARALEGAEFAFISVPTPPSPDGGLDEGPLRSALEEVARHVHSGGLIIVNKSTVPPGTADRLIAPLGLRYVANPEFLAQGRALQDFRRPSRIVLGSPDPRAIEEVRGLYSAIPAPILVTDTVSAELGKLASNGFLALKISYVNGLAAMAEAVGADTDEVLSILAHDPRIGQGHLRAGLGFGGSCLPKDVGAMEQLAQQFDVHPELFAAASQVNQAVPARVFALVASRLGGLAQRRIAVLGVTYKAGTDDVSHSPALGLARRLADEGADVVVYDPRAPVDAIGRLQRRGDPLEAAQGADAVILGTDEPEVGGIDLVALRAVMRGRLLVDGRGVLRPAEVFAAGLTYYGFGRGGRARPG